MNIFFYNLDRPEAGSSIRDGSIELMVHRRTLNDDHFGVGEPINETAYGTGLVVRGQHFLIFETPSSSALYHRPIAQNFHLRPLHTYALVNTSYPDYANTYVQSWSALNQSLPFNVHLLTFDQLSQNTFLVRIEHYFERNEDTTYSQPVQFDLQILFGNVGKINDIVELTLAANLPLSEMKRLVWTTNENESSEWKDKKRDLDGTIVTLNAMEIRTFNITIQ